MDPTLATIYGTPGAEDTEKTAAAELAAELTEGEEMNVDGLSEEELEAVAAEVVGSEETEETEVEETEIPENVKMAAAQLGVEPEQLIEADTLGRAMAHAFVQESMDIEKTAAGKKKAPSFGDKAKAFGKKVDKGANKYFDKAVKKSKEFGGKVGEKASAGAKRVAGSKVGKFVAKHGKSAGRFVKRHRGLAAAGGLAAAAGGTAAAMRKEASALDQLVERRALEMLEESGFEVETQTEKQAASKYDVLANEVEARAIALLEQNGYELVEETEETEE